jgi:hypothetical protein
MCNNLTFKYTSWSMISWIDNKLDIVNYKFNNFSFLSSTIISTEISAEFFLYQNISSYRLTLVSFLFTFLIFDPIILYLSHINCTHHIILINMILHHSNYESFLFLNRHQHIYMWIYRNTKHKEEQLYSYINNPKCNEYITIPKYA